MRKVILFWITIYFRTRGPKGAFEVCTTQNFCKFFTCSWWNFLLLTNMALMLTNKWLWNRPKETWPSSHTNYQQDLKYYGYDGQADRNKMWPIYVPFIFSNRLNVPKAKFELSVQDCWIDKERRTDQISLSITCYFCQAWPHNDYLIHIDRSFCYLKYTVESLKKFKMFIVSHDHYLHFKKIGISPNWLTLWTRGKKFVG